MDPFDRPTPERRGDDLKDFYRILGKLEDQTNGARRLKDCNGRLTWPERGVYFFMEHGELRTDTGQGPRIVRVDTHALREGSRTALWTRLSQHKGQAKTGGGTEGQYSD